MIPAAKPLICEDERKAVDAVLASGGLAQGPHVAGFEGEFSKPVGGVHCVAVNSGTSALHLALITLGISRGDEVIVPSFTFGRVQLVKLPGWTTDRQRNAAFLTDHPNGVFTPDVDPRAVHVYHQYTIRVPGHDRDAFVAALAKHGVGSGVYYPLPVHRLPSFDMQAKMPLTAGVADEVISLPVHPSLTSADPERIVEAVSRTAGAGA